MSFHYEFQNLNLAPSSLCHLCHSSSFFPHTFFKIAGQKGLENLVSENYGNIFNRVLIRFVKGHEFEAPSEDQTHSNDHYANG